MILLAGSAGRSADADEFHFAPGMIEGRVVEETTDFIRIETVAGVVAVPASVVQLRVAGPSRMDRYAAMRDELPLSPDRNAEIAAWCFDVGLREFGNRHLEAALASDPRSESALALAGYVQLGELWIKAGAPPAPPSKVAKTPPQTILEKLRNGWHRRLNTIYETMSGEGQGRREFELARTRLRSLREPMIIPLVSRVLEPGGTAIRLVLIEVLADYPQDAATLHLLVLAVLDPSPDVRRASVTEISRRPGKKMADWLRLALRCENEAVVSRAAQALGWLKDRSAMSDLVDHLATDRGQPTRASVSSVFDALNGLFPAPVVVPLGEETVDMPTGVAFAGYRRRIDRLARRIERPTGDYRTEVQDALIAITGENLGFDVTAWREWVARNPPIEAALP